MVVRRAAPFKIGAVRGLRTLVFQSTSRSLFTIRRAALAENIVFSFGGLHDVAAVGLRRRCVRFMGATDPPLVEERRLIAVPILRASERSKNFSSSDPEELPQLSAGVTSEEVGTFWTLLKLDGRTVFVPISRNGEIGELSEADKDIMAGGDPSTFFDKNPVWKRLERGFRSIEALGGVGIGDEPL